MIGIYKITRKETGKVYIGQTNNYERRIKEHCAPSAAEKSRIAVDKAIKKYGKEAFDFELIEECTIEQLNEKEKYWIKYYKAQGEVYNETDGGDQQSVGSNNGRAKLNEADVIKIRTAYANHERQKDVYENFKDKVSWSTFQAAWQGKTWSHIMPEVFTDENKKYYIYNNCKGSNSACAIFTDEEVIELRKRYVNETAQEIYKDYKDRIKYQTLQQILWGRWYTELPVYKKKEKKWINI